MNNALSSTIPFLRLPFELPTSESNPRQYHSELGLRFNVVYRCPPPQTPVHLPDCLIVLQTSRSALLTSWVHPSTMLLCSCPNFPSSFWCFGAFPHVTHWVPPARECQPAHRAVMLHAGYPAFPNTGHRQHAEQPAPKPRFFRGSACARMGFSFAHPTTFSASSQHPGRLLFGDPTPPQCIHHPSTFFIDASPLGSSRGDRPSALC